MALNAAAQGHSGLDVISDGAITEFYNLMEEAMKVSEVMPGRYNIITSPSYANPCPVAESSFTTVDISTGQPNVVSLDNTYITANLKVHLTVDAAHTYTDLNPCVYFVGFKSSLDAISKYQIYHNGKMIYDQPFCSEEAYVLQTIVPDHVKYTRPKQYTSHENAWNFDSNVCGTYVTLDKTGANKSFDAIIPLKIDITQFLTFGEFRYLPGFFGTWGIRMWFSSQNLVICPVDPARTIGVAAPTSLQRRFTQIGHKFKGITNFVKSTGVFTVADVTFTTNGCITERVMLNSAQFALQFPVYDSLKARYFTDPLAIPVCAMLYGRFSGNMSKDAGFSSTYNAAISCCEALFLLPYVNDQHHTVCRNPRWKGAFLNVSGYGNFPQQYVDTVPSGDDCEAFTRFHTLTLDALNINNSDLMSMTKELAASLCSNYVNQTLVTSAGTTYTATENSFNSEDDTNFLFGIPFANSDDFQGGLTTNGQAQMKFQTNGSDMQLPAEVENPALGITAMFLVDRAILLRTLPYSEQPQVKIVEEKLRIAAPPPQA